MDWWLLLMLEWLAIITGPLKTGLFMTAALYLDGDRPVVRQPLQWRRFAIFFRALLIEDLAISLRELAMEG